jgi:hypothetical protein
LYLVKFVILIEMLVKIQVFLDVTRCQWVSSWLMFWRV